MEQLKLKIDPADLLYDNVPQGVLAPREFPCFDYNGDGPIISAENAVGCVTRIARGADTDDLCDVVNGA